MRGGVADSEYLDEESRIACARGQVSGADCAGRCGERDGTRAGNQALDVQALLAKRIGGIESLVSAVRSTAHVFDHYWERGVAVPPPLLTRMEVLLKEIAHREVELDPSLLWALQMYAIAKMKLRTNYLKLLQMGAGQRGEAAALGGIATRE